MRRSHCRITREAGSGRERAPGGYETRFQLDGPPLTGYGFSESPGDEVAKTHCREIGGLGVIPGAEACSQFQVAKAILDHSRIGVGGAKKHASEGEVRISRQGLAKLLDG